MVTFRRVSTQSRNIARMSTLSESLECVEVPASSQNLSKCNKETNTNNSVKCEQPYLSGNGSHIDRERHGGS